MWRPLSSIAIVAAVLTACTPKPHQRVPSEPSPEVRLAAAAAELRVGCLACLEQAFDQYRALILIPGVGEAAARGAIDSALLIAIRENELGLIDSGHLEAARASAPAASSELTVQFTAAAALSTKPRGSARSPVTLSESSALATISRNQLNWISTLRSLMPGDLLADYLWLGLACGPSGFDVPDRVDRAPVLAGALDLPLIAYKNASSCSLQRDAVKKLLDEQPRFIELRYLLGLGNLSEAVRVGGRAGDALLQEADELFQAAYAWRPNWPSLTMTIANVALTAEDFSRAIEFYDKTLALSAEDGEALMGRIRALTYVGRHEDAIATTDRLLAINRRPGEARYWRALNEEQLERHDSAWDDVERAAEGMVSPDVAKLAGLIAINRHQLDTARQRLELALSGRPSDCETRFYLQAVFTEQRQWIDSARVAASAATCFDGDLARLSGEIEALQTADMPAEKRAKQIEKREQQRASARRMRAATLYDAAAANYNLSRKTEARQFAERLLDDEQYRDRARDLLSRLPMLQ